MPLLDGCMPRASSSTLASYCSMPPFSSFLNTPNQTSTSPASMPSSTSRRRLSNESFSFSWLAAADAAKPSFETGPYVLSTAPRSSTSDAYEFDFGLSRPLSPALLHADQIFSNGFLLPLHLVADPSKSESTTASESSGSTLSRSLSLDSSDSYISFSSRHYRPQHPGCCDDAAGRLASLEGSPLLPTSSSGGAKSTRLPFLKSCARKYLCLSFLFPWSKKAGRLRLLAPETEIRAPLTAGDDASAQRCRRRRISDNSYESAIDEAILHCKKSV